MARHTTYHAAPGERVHVSRGGGSGGDGGGGCLLFIVLLVIWEPIVYFINNWLFIVLGILTIVLVIGYIINILLEKHESKKKDMTNTSVSKIMAEMQPAPNAKKRKCPICGNRISVNILRDHISSHLP